MSHQSRLGIDHQVMSRVVVLFVAQRIDEQRLFLRHFFRPLGVAAFNRKTSVLPDPTPLADIGLVTFDARWKQVRPFVRQPVIAWMLNRLTVGVDPYLPFFIEKVDRLAILIGDPGLWPEMLHVSVLVVVDGPSQ